MPAHPSGMIAEGLRMRPEYMRIFPVRVCRMIPIPNVRYARADFQLHVCRLCLLHAFCRMHSKRNGVYFRAEDARRCVTANVLATLSSLLWITFVCLSDENVIRLLTLCVCVCSCLLCFPKFNSIRYYSSDILCVCVYVIGLNITQQQQCVFLCGTSLIMSPARCMLKIVENENVYDKDAALDIAKAPHQDGLITADSIHIVMESISPDLLEKVRSCGQLLIECCILIVCCI